MVKGILGFWDGDGFSVCVYRVRILNTNINRLHSLFCYRLSKFLFFVADHYNHNIPKDTLKSVSRIAPMFNKMAIFIFNFCNDVF